MLIGDGWSTCDHCERKLTGRQRKFCSESCRVAEWRESKRPRQYRDCELCGDPFPVRYRNQRVCDYNSRASEDCKYLQEELMVEWEDAQDELRDAVCEREGCEISVYRPGPGRPKRFCSDRCKTAHYRATKRACEPA